MSKESLRGRLIIRGKLTMKSPLLIGSGTNDDKNQTDIQIVKDKDEIPFIPGTSLTGVLRQYVEEDNPRAAALLFGSSRDYPSAYEQELQSSVTIYDVKLSNADIVHRDSVNLDSITGTTINAGKFDYEVIEQGAHGIFAADILFRGIHEPESELLRSCLTRLGTYLSHGFPLGAHTAIGFGQAVISDIEVMPYDFRTPEDTEAWFLGQPAPNQFLFKPQAAEHSYPQDDLIIKASFSLHNSLLVRDTRKEILDLAVNTDNDENAKLDAVMMQDNDGNWLLPGSSIKGVLRHRAEYILHALNKDASLLEKLMGPDPQKLREHLSPKQRSRFRVKEAKVTNVKYYPQSRVRIDRFTGGNIDGSLLTTGPVWKTGKKDTSLSMQWEIHNANEWEIGLTLLLLKDVWLGKVAFGGEKSIGRGTLNGLKADLYYHNSHITFGEDGSVSAEDAQTMQKFVDAFVKQKETTA